MVDNNDVDEFIRSKVDSGKCGLCGSDLKDYKNAEGNDIGLQCVECGVVIVK